MGNAGSMFRKCFGADTSWASVQAVLQWRRSTTRKTCNLHTTTTMLALILGLIATIAASLAIAIPLTGALVRLRANFNPKSIQLDDEGNVEPHAGPVVTSFFGMLKRVKRIEAGTQSSFHKTARLISVSLS